MAVTAVINIEGALNKRRAWQPTPLFLPGEQWMEEASGL